MKPVGEPVLLIELTAGAGTERWMPAGRSETLDGAHTSPREWLRFDFKTRPQREASALQP